MTARKPKAIECAVDEVFEEIAKGPASPHDVQQRLRYQHRVVHHAIGCLRQAGRIVEWGRIEMKKEAYTVFSIPEHAQERLQ